MVFFTYSCSRYSKEACYSFLVLVPTSAKNNGLLCLFLFHLQLKAWFSLHILVPTTAKSWSSLLVLSTTAEKHVILGLFLFQLQQKTWSSLLILVQTTTKRHFILCLLLFQGAAMNHGFLSQGRRIPTTYLLPLTWLLGLLLVLPYLKFIDYFSLEVSIIDYMLPRRML